MDSRVLAALLGFSFVALVIAVWFGRRGSTRNGKKPSVGGFAWALLFLTGGRMPQPPPQSQIEQEAGERKNREFDRNKES